MPQAKASAAPRAADASGADSRATAAGETTELGATAAAEPEISPRERAVDLDIFLEKWRLELATPIVEHAFNPNWPENRLATQKKYQERVLVGLVFHALHSVSWKIDEAVQPHNCLAAVLKPTPGVYAYAGLRYPGNRTEPLRRAEWGEGMGSGRAGG